MKVDRIGSDYVSLERISPDSRDPRRTPSDGLAKITGYNAFSVDVDVVDVKDSNYDPYNALKDLKAGDRVAVVPFTPDEGKTWEAGEVYVPETVSGRLADVGLYMNTSKRDGNAVSITIGGTKYVINEWNLDMLDVKKPQIDATRKDVTGYLAKDGTVLWTTEIGNSDAWMVVGDYYQATNSSGKVVWFAHGWTIGGEEVDIDLGTIRNQAEKYAPGELVHYDISNGTTGEYVLSKPNANRNSLRYSDGAQAFGEPGTANEKTGEGVYNVAQYVKTNSNSNSAFEIHPSNSLIPLERYKGTDITSAEHTAAGGAIFASEKDANGKPDPAKPHTWNYRSTTYKDTGVKFIYVSFSPVTGEVDYISVRNGVQNVKNEELTYQNTIWNNTATHNVVDTARTWVISPAEAYVNDKGHVEAVVIKSEPTVADLSNVVIVGKVVGTEVGKNTGAEEVSALTNVRTREYWQGPDFSEKKTGSFKNQHNTGDVLVIRSTDTNGVMDCKTFNSGVYGNRNPDVIWAKDIVKLTSAAGDPAKIAFYIGRGTGFVWDQARNDIRVKSSADKTVDNMIMTDRQTEGDQLWDLTEFKNQDYKGLVKVTGSTKWLDLREEEWGHDVRNLSDLYDLDLTTVEIKVLLNGNETSDAFRSAYAVVVLAGKPSSDAPGTTTSGNITLDSASSKLLGSVNNSYGTLALNRLSGDIVANIKVSAPDWAVDANTSVTYDLEVKANGKSVGTMTNKVANKAADGTFTDTPFISVLGALNSKLISVDDVFTGVIKNVRWANSGVKYVYEDGKDASDTLTAGYTDSLSNTVARALGFTYTMPTTTHQQKDSTAGTTYSITGATPAQTKISYADGSPVSTVAVKANNGWVTVTINNVVEKAPAQTFTVKASADNKVLFAEIATNSAAGVAAVASGDWKTSLSVAAGKFVAIKNADGSGIASVVVNETATGAGVTADAVATTDPAVFSFEMPAADVTVYPPASDTPVAEYFTVKTPAYDKMNIKLAAGGKAPTTDDERLAIAAAALKTTVQENVSGVKYVGVDGNQITADMITAADNLAVVKVNGGKEVVTAGVAATSTVKDALDLAGITLGDNASQYVILDKGATKVAVPTTNTSNDLSTKLTGVQDIITNGTDGFAKMDTTPIAVIPDTGATGIAATNKPTLAAPTAGIYNDGANDYYPLNTNLTIVATFATAIDSTALTAGLKFVDNSSTGATMTVDAASGKVAAGTGITAGQTLNVIVKLTSPSTTPAQIKLTTADA
nr:hypothetical protein [uncultured Oscillibacter sp.]